MLFTDLAALGGVCDSARGASSGMSASRQSSVTSKSSPSTPSIMVQACEPASLLATSIDLSRGASLMASRLNPYISFPGTARQALEFYEGVFGGTLTLSTFGEYGEPGMPDADNIMHGMLETDHGFTLMGADTPPGMDHEPGNSMAVSLSGDDAEELRRYWEKLADGGTVSVPLEKQMWGDEFGMCADKFGVAWMVNIAQVQA